MSATKALFSSLALLLVLTLTGAQDYNVGVQRPRAAATGGTNWTTSTEYCWVMTASSGATNNCTASGANATQQGPAAYVAGPAGSAANTAFDFNNGANFIVADSVFGAEANTLTWGFWYQDEDVVAGIAMHKGTVTILDTTLLATDKMRARSSASLVEPTGTMGAGWKHYAMTISGDTTRLYINGVEDCGGACPTNGTGHTDNAIRLTMGSDSSDGGIIGGPLHEVFYDTGTVLTASQICGIAKWGLAGNLDHTSLISCTE